MLTYIKKKINIAIECDENGHKNIDKNKEYTRENEIKNLLNCKFYRFNPDEKNFNFNNIVREIIKLIKIEIKI